MKKARRGAGNPLESRIHRLRATLAFFLMLSLAPMTQGVARADAVGLIVMSGGTLVRWDGTGFRPASSPPKIGADPSWSPDGTEIASVVISEADWTENEIQVTSADGSTRRVGPAMENLRDLSWSPDGTKFLFTAGPVGDNQIYLMEDEGTISTPVVVSTPEGPGSEDWGWRPDGAAFNDTGTRIAFTLAGNLWSVSPTGTGAQQLTDFCQGIQEDTGACGLPESGATPCMHHGLTRECSAGGSVAWHGDTIVYELYVNEWDCGCDSDQTLGEYTPTSDSYRVQTEGASDPAFSPNDGSFAYLLNPLTSSSFQVIVEGQGVIAEGWEPDWQPCPGGDCPDFLLSEADTTPPETRITGGPKGKTSKRTATFKFASSEPGSTFRCKLDKGGWRPCASPKTYGKLSLGTHLFRVAATDPAGNTDPTPARRAFRVVRG